MHWEDWNCRSWPILVVFTIKDEVDRMLWSNYILVYRADKAADVGGTDAEK